MSQEENGVTGAGQAQGFVLTNSWLPSLERAATSGVLSFAPWDRFWLLGGVAFNFGSR